MNIHIQIWFWIFLSCTLLSIPKGVVLPIANSGTIFRTPSRPPPFDFGQKVFPLQTPPNHVIGDQTKEGNQCTNYYYDPGVALEGIGHHDFKVTACPAVHIIHVPFISADTFSGSKSVPRVGKHIPAKKE